MKKILAVLFAVLLSVPAFAEGTLMDWINGGSVEVKQGVAYSVVDNAFNYTATIPVTEWKSFHLSVGYAGRAKNTGDKLIGTIGYKPVLSQYLNTPALLDDLEIGAYFGGGRLDLKDLDDSESDAGIYITAINLTF